MSNVTVQEALKSAIEALTSNNDFKKKIDALEQCKAALSEIEKCEPVGEVVMVHEPEWMKPREGFKWYQTEFPLGTKFYTSPQPIEKCEPVGELILDPAFLPALKAPLVNWKINLVDLEVGTKFYTSPQPIEKCEPVGELSVDYQGFSAYRRIKDLPEGYHKVYTSPISKECEPINEVYEFEKWLKENTLIRANLTIDLDYADPLAEIAYRAWKARAKLNAEKG